VKEVDIVGRKNKDGIGIRDGLVACQCQGSDRPSRGKKIIDVPHVRLQSQKCP